MNEQGREKSELIKAADTLAQADSLVVYAGAGMSADSGLRVFRGSEGVYSGQDDEPEARYTAQWFQSCPEEAWRYYWLRIEACLNATPHSGYFSLKKIIEYLSIDYFIYTSNVDGFFEAAGFPQTRLMECHGNLFNLQCTKTKGHDVWNLKRQFNREQLLELSRKGRPLTCPRCGELARPNVLMFDDSQWVSRPYWAQQDAYLRWERINRGKLIVKLEVGAGNGISSVRNESELFPGTLLRINPDCTEVTGNAIGVKERAEESLLELEGLIVTERKTGPE